MIMDPMRQVILITPTTANLPGYYHNSSWYPDTYDLGIPPKRYNIRNIGKKTVEMIHCGSQHFRERSDVRSVVQ